MIFGYTFLDQRLFCGRAARWPKTTPLGEIRLRPGDESSFTRPFRPSPISLRAAAGKTGCVAQLRRGATKRRVKRCEVGRHRLRRKAAYAEALDRGAARRRTENHGFGEADPTGRRVDRGAGGVEGRDALCC